MRKQWFAMILITILLSSCATSTQAIVPKLDLPQIQFLDYRFDEHTEEYATQNGVSVNLHGIHAIDKDTLFVFGSLKAEYWHRFLLLRSSDAGKHWQEVNPPNDAESFYHVVFVENGVGWAFTARDIEELSFYDLYQSSDYGKTWTSPIKMGGFWYYVWGVEFFDKENGQITFNQSTANPWADRFGVTTTTDGGRTWTETRTSPDDGSFDTFEKLKSLYVQPPSSSYGRHWINVLECCDLDKPSVHRAQGHDGSEWLLFYDQPSTEYIILSRTKPNTSWSVASTILNKFKYDLGHISMP